MNEASRRTTWGVLASCAVHAAVTLGPSRQQPVREQVPAPLWMELQLQQQPSVPAPPSPVASLERNAPPAQQSPPPPRERSAGKRVSGVQPTRRAPVEAAPAPSEALPEQTLAAPTANEPPAPTLDLSPLAAARTLGDATSLPPHDAGAARGDDVPLSPMAQAHALARQVPGIRVSHGLSRSLEAAALDAVEDTLYNVLRPWKLLQRTMRGSQYRYTGGGFDAAILPDGRVRFRDKDGTNLTLSTIQTRETGPGNALPPAPTVGLSVGDPRALWQRLRGKDPFAAERRLFLERTRALREYLAGRAAERGTSGEDEQDAAEPEPQLEPPARP